MEKINDYKLIDGTFKASDASKILLEIINNKINYHNLQAFLIKEKFDGDVSHSEKRVNQLIKMGKSLKKTLESAEKKGLNVKIHCPIEIEVVSQSSPKKK